MKQKIIQQGAEAIIELTPENKILKRRVKKSYRIPELDKQIRKLRTRAEAKIMEKASKIIPVPKIEKADEKTGEIIMEFIDGKKLSQHLDEFPIKGQKQILKQIGESIAKLHKENIVHGDLTTSNMIYGLDNELDDNKNKLDKNDKSTRNIQNKTFREAVYPLTNLSAKKSAEGDFGANKSCERSEEQFSSNSKNFKIYFIDFGLAFQNAKYEDKAVDIHLLRQALEAKHFEHWEELYKEFIKGYRFKNKSDAERVLNQLNKVEKRGRYKEH